MTDLKSNKTCSKKLVEYSVNILLICVVLLLLFVPEAKAWVLRQMISIGFFKADISTPDPKQIQIQESLSFSFKDNSGALSSIDEYKGKIVFINFWASWCPPCLAEMPSLQKLFNEFKSDKEVVFLFINEDGVLQKGIDYMKKNQFSMPVFCLASQPPPAIYEGTLPTTVVLDKQGKIVFKEEGIANYYTPDFIKQLRDLR